MRAPRRIISPADILKEKKYEHLMYQKEAIRIKHYIDPNTSFRYLSNI